MSRRNTSRKYLPAELTRLDLPVPNQLILAHSQKVVPDQKSFFDTTSHALMEPLFKHGKIHGFQFERCFLPFAKDYRLWFFFDRAYCLQALKTAVEANREEISVCRVVKPYPVPFPTHTDAILMARDSEALKKYAGRSPIIRWLSMIAVGQPEDETWSYCLLPPCTVKHD